MNKFINYAHRGASAYAPENTMSAFRKAIELEANGIELDLQKAKDGKIVIFHDDFIDEKSNGIGTISDYTYNELLKFDFGSWFDLKYKDERINEAKRRAAFEITKLVHGEEAAIKAEEATKAMFEGKGNVEAMESTKVEIGCTIIEALVNAGIAPSKGQAKTLISQGAISLNDEKIDDIAYVLKEEDFKEGYAILRKGKKIYHKLTK